MTGHVPLTCYMQFYFIPYVAPADFDKYWIPSRFKNTTQCSDEHSSRKELLNLSTPLKVMTTLRKEVIIFMQVLMLHLCESHLLGLREQIKLCLHHATT